uniref:Uncharacterized protein n=1 Tax=Oryza sativa subsp. japonica TaxID=39947 RepID=Q851Z5_ORYSJ|nr:hypothetical protein [Oryza sativa Japonica Group]
MAMARKWSEAEHQNTIEESERRGRGGATAEGARRRAVKAEERSERRRRGEERYAPGASSPTCGGEHAGAGRRRRGLASWWWPEMEVGAPRASSPYLRSELGSGTTASRPRELVVAGDGSRRATGVVAVLAERARERDDGVAASRVGGGRRWKSARHGRRRRTCGASSGAGRRRRGLASWRWPEMEVGAPRASSPYLRSELGSGTTASRPRELAAGDGSRRATGVVAVLAERARERDDGVAASRVGGGAERRRRSLSRWRRNSQATVADLPRRRRCAAARLDSTSRTLAF